MTRPQHELWGWEAFFDNLKSFIEDADRHLGNCTYRYACYAAERMEMCVQFVSHLKEHIQDHMTSISQPNFVILNYYLSEMESLVPSLRLLCQEWQRYIEVRERLTESVSYSAPSEHVSRRGRPRFTITREQLLYLRALCFTWTDIASLLGVSRMTIFRRRQEFGMLADATNIMDDTQLRLLLSDLRKSSPQLGEVMVMGHLRSLGYNVPRARVRSAIRATDPINTALRWQGTVISRRPYSVPGPNSLWHIDGHHKLIRWKMVTHAGIDGFSRMIMFMKCSTNNEATTVYNLFLDAVSQLGLPSRVRTDYGGENRLVAQHMLENRGTHRSSVMTGSSVHNQRIERLWRDMHECVTKLFYRLFYFLEEQGLLNPDDDVHLFALHYVYVPRINRALLCFKDGWNNHGIRTEHNQSPNQLFVVGALRLRQSGLTALDFFDRVSDTYGVEEDGLPDDDSSDGVAIPQVAFTLTNEHLQLLQQNVNPLDDSDNHGIELYERTLHSIYNIVSQNPDIYS